MNAYCALIAFLKSFRYAARGIAQTFGRPRNRRIAAVAGVVVGGAGFYFGISRTEWCLVVLAYATVWTAEALNTALELLADAVSTEPHPMVGKAKDAAAGAVLVTAVAAILVGMIVFVPHVLKLFIR